MFLCLWWICHIHVVSNWIYFRHYEDWTSEKKKLVSWWNVEANYLLMQPFLKGRLIKWHLVSLLNRLRHNFTIVLIAFIFLVAIYQETICYFVSSWSWYQLKTKEKSSRFIKILIVADPQLQGYTDEPPLLGYVTRYDADR